MANGLNKEFLNPEPFQKRGDRQIVANLKTPNRKHSAACRETIGSVTNIYHFNVCNVYTYDRRDYINVSIIIIKSTHVC